MEAKWRALFRVDEAEANGGKGSTVQDEFDAGRGGLSLRRGRGCAERGGGAEEPSLYVSVTILRYSALLRYSTTTLLLAC